MISDDFPEDRFGHMILDDFDERLQVGSLGPAGRPWDTMAFGWLWDGGPNCFNVDFPMIFPLSQHWFPSHVRRCLIHDPIGDGSIPQTPSIFIHFS